MILDVRNRVVVHSPNHVRNGNKGVVIEMQARGPVELAKVWFDDDCGGGFDVVLTQELQRIRTPEFPLTEAQLAKIEQALDAEQEGHMDARTRAYASLVLDRLRGQGGAIAMHMTTLLTRLHIHHMRIIANARILDADAIADALTEYTATVNALLVEVAWQRETRPLIEATRLHQEEAANPND